MEIVAVYISLLLMWNEAAGDCPDRWDRRADRCYFIGPTPSLSKNYSAAESACQKMGATLVTITDEQENNVINEVIIDNGGVGYDYWIGLTKYADVCPSSVLVCRRNEWLWADETPYDETQWHAWSDNEPTAGPLCAFYSAHSWYGYSCELSLRYICEKASNSTTDTTQIVQQVTPVSSQTSKAPTSQKAVTTPATSMSTTSASTSSSAVATNNESSSDPCLCGDVDQLKDAATTYMITLIAVSSAFGISLVLHVVTLVVSCRQRASQPATDNKTNLAKYGHENHSSGVQAPVRQADSIPEYVTVIGDSTHDSESNAGYEMPSTSGPGNARSLQPPNAGYEIPLQTSLSGYEVPARADSVRTYETIRGTFNYEDPL